MRWKPALALFVALSLPACAGLPGLPGLPGVQPEIEGVDARIAGVDLRGLDVVFDVRVYNPLLSSLHVPRFRYAVDMQGRTLASGRQTAGTEFPAAGTGTVSIPVHVTFREIAAVYGSLEGRREAEYDLTGEFKVPLFGGTIDLPFAKSGTVPIVRAPEIAVQSVDTSGLSALGGEIALDVQLTNPNSFALGLDELSYGLLVRGAAAGLLKGTTGGAVAPGATRTLRLTASVSAIDAAKGLIAGNGDLVRVAPSGSVSTPFGPLTLR